MRLRSIGRRLLKGKQRTLENKLLRYVKLPPGDQPLLLSGIALFRGLCGT